MKILRWIYTAYGLLAFLLLFFVFFIPLLIPITFPRQHHLVGVINRWWGWCIFTSFLLPVRIEYRTRLDRRHQYIFCPNHTSYLDIPLMALNRINTIFVGKSALEKIPLFGFMYRKLHITVDRTNMRSRFNTIKRSLAAIDEGKNLVIYPEGGIVSPRPPILATTFKDGAFRVAIEKQIPIVPVTIPYNWIILPGHNLILRWRPVRLIFHEPIETKGTTFDDMDRLKKQVREVITAEMNKQLNRGD